MATGSGATYSYDVFGNVRSQTGSSGNEFTYAGEQTDSTGGPPRAGSRL